MCAPCPIGYALADENHTTANCEECNGTTHYSDEEGLSDCKKATACSKGSFAVKLPTKTTGLVCQKQIVCSAGAADDGKPGDVKTLGKDRTCAYKSCRKLYDAKKAAGKTPKSRWYGTLLLLNLALRRALALALVPSS